MNNASGQDPKITNQEFDVDINNFNVLNAE